MNAATEPAPISTKDGLTLARRRWTVSAGEPRADVVFIHGYADHSGRHEAVTVPLAEAGFQVDAYDLRGHGRSDGPRVLVPSFDVMADDLMRVLEAVRAGAPDRPLFLYGHSMGGLIATFTCLYRNPYVAGAVLSSPAIQLPTDLSPLLQRLAGLLARIAPRLRTTRIDPAGLSHDPRVVAAYLADPLVDKGGIPARTGAELLKAGRRVRSDADRFSTPFLAFHGTADPIVDPAGTRLLYERAPVADKTLYLDPGLFHETHHEPTGPDVVARAIAWINRMMNDE